MPPEDPRLQGRCSNPKNPHHKALQEIRKSLLPFANEPVTSGPETRKHTSQEPPFIGFDEVRWFSFVLLLSSIREGIRGSIAPIKNNHSVAFIQRVT